jgi:hypothetical protein
MCKIVLLILLAVAVFISVALALGSRRWQSATRKMHAKLDDGRQPVVPETYAAGDLADLPEPVQRYFQAVLKDGQPMISALNVEHTGTFNMSETGDQWKPFSSTQRVLTQRPGFVWEGEIRVMPGLTVRVHDAYVAGEGVLHASLLGLLTLVDLRGTPDVAEGELMRFLAEAPWYPTALLPSQGLRWEAVDDGSARATLKDGKTDLTLLFRFDKEGLIESVRAEARGRRVSGELIPTPWEGRWSRHEVRCGMLIPTEGEVGWVLPEGLKPYWRGRITRIAYEFMQ